jgi:hypothetical protein
MQYERGERLGVLCDGLGISPNARVNVSNTEQATVINDLETGTRHEIPSADPTNIQSTKFEVPKYVQEIGALSDAELVDQFRQSLGNLNLKEMSALRSECGFRGIDPLD